MLVPPGFGIVGLPDTAIRKARTGCLCINGGAGCQIARLRLTLPLPIYARKELIAVALGIMACIGKFDRQPKQLHDCRELSLSGDIRPYAVCFDGPGGTKSGCRELILPADNG